MRLQELTMCAFGPYREVQTIDFTKINDKQLFLISGPTGAGKTTIFDAISYALFGNSSGNERDGDSLRSDFASFDDETFVSLQFELKGKQYSIRRSPKQERLKVKGEGTTVKQAEAILEDGIKTYTGVTEVNQKIQEILGIDYHQFRQIVMLPQGEFRKLLEASSADREVIFRKLFKTGSFLSFQERLKEKAKALKQETDDIYKLLENDVSHIIYDDDSELAHSVNADYLYYETIISLLEEKLSDDQIVLEGLKDKIEKKEKNILKLAADIEKGESINEKFEKRILFTEHKKQLVSKEEEIRTLELKVDKGQKAKIIYQIDEKIKERQKSLALLEEKEKKTQVNLEDTMKQLDILEKEVSVKEKEVEKIGKLKEDLFGLKDKYKKYEEYEEKLKVFEKLKIQKESLDKDSKVKKGNIDRLEKEIETVRLNLETIKEKSNTQNEIILRLDTQTALIKEKEYLKGIVNDVITLRKNHRNLSINYQNDNEAFQEEKTNYENNLQAYLLGQAGILAKELKDNDPCPVCGATEHPKKARLLDDVPLRDELETLKKDLDNHEEKVQTLYRDVYRVNQEIIEKLKIYQRICDTADFDEEKALEKITGEIKKETILLKEYEVKLQEIKALLTQKVEIEMTLKDKEEIYEKLSIEYEKLTALNQELTNQLQVKKEQLYDYEMSVVREYESKEDLEKEIKTLNNHIKMIEETYEKLTGRKTKLKDALLIYQTNLKNINETKELDLSSLEKEEIAFYDALQVHQFNDRTDYETYLFDEIILKEMNKTIREYYDEMSFVEKTLKELNLVLQGKEKIDVNGIKQKQEEESTVLSKLRQQEKDGLFNSQNNKKILLNLNSRFNKVKKKRAEYEIISHLSKAANGDNPQRLTFERYVLAAYFDEIIKAANLRLSDMTNNRYFLIRKEEKGKGISQQGLDLEVVDNYTSKSRLVKTLSGGEAFIASLSLALGLADVVQSYSGGIQLDTIFIDEGFGSLDPESLEQAIVTLIGIQKSGRLVGIISHVQELKERIDVKLEILPSQSGSHVKLVV